MIDISKVKTIHCIGIGGIGLSAIADILLNRGYSVTGSDMNPSEKVDELVAHGAKIAIGHKAENVGNADLLVYSSAVSNQNPEMLYASEHGIPCLTRAQMLGILMSEYEESVAVSGTHGKTTTTSMISLILDAAKKQPTILVGGNLNEIGGNVKLGNSEYFVTEACEYMDSFLELKPKCEIILNIDSDHLDYFKDIDHIVSSFSKFADQVPEDGVIIAYDANPFVKSVMEGRNNVVTFGIGVGHDYHAEDISFNDDGNPTFTVYHDEDKLLELSLNLPGEHNILNALAAVATADTKGIGADVIKETLESFHGTQRRFDLMGQTKGDVKIIDDYAHHPTEIKATLTAVSKMHYGNVWVIFQPHTYTRTMALFDEFPEAFKSINNIILAEIYAAREKNIHKISSKALADEIKKRYPEKNVYFFPAFEEIAKFVYNNTMAGDMVMTMGAGDVYKIGEMILDMDKE